ncbi:hypothetical protein [Massilia sp. CF038]|uniref:hypothetical protein n=1 Tax=Massilia sp. CF038 TaxID=1881045 RepID=UPI0009120621|nr:hypothetical protein [Massilia sp. CF038]SHG36519.1 hypothetical protein SAMN05428948_0097 [Massilia sp. CF038]
MSLTLQQYGVVPVIQMQGDEEEDTRLLRALLEDATGFMSGFRWCKAIRSRHFGMGVGGLFAVFLFEIENAADPGDALLWVISGDLPPAYLVLEGGSTDPAQALATYVDLMQAWADAAGQGASVADLIPVNVAPTQDNARALGSRLAYLREHFLAA